ncbi:hypothetical protein MPY17_33920 [Rhodococcus opacus]|nr:hypothetical protein [Rhodococcus opacus]UOT03839.1 hypothetical protein MPY17_33920 [Rhodococcus opacus]
MCAAPILLIGRGHGGRTLGGGLLRIERAKVGTRAFLGSSGMTGRGRRVPKNRLVAVLSAAPSKSKPGSSWLGSPPVRLRRAATESDSARTFAPPLRLEVARAAVETCRLIPVKISFAIGLPEWAGGEGDRSFSSARSEPRWRAGGCTELDPRRHPVVHRTLAVAPPGSACRHPPDMLPPS